MLLKKIKMLYKPLIKTFKSFIKLGRNFITFAGELQSIYEPFTKYFKHRL